MLRKFPYRTEKTLIKSEYVWKAFEKLFCSSRFAFNKAEKKLLLDSEKSTDNSCRRPVVRIIKGFLVDFDWRGLRSYHIKTILLHEFETYGDINKWKRFVGLKSNTLFCIRKSL